VNAVINANVIAFYLPMHTATRLALPVIDRVQAMNPTAQFVPTVCTPLNETCFDGGVSSVLGPEAEELVRSGGSPPSRKALRRTRKTRLYDPCALFIQPDRAGL
jgi:hypothetical protein